MQLLKMTPKSVFFALCNKKLFALITSAYLIPQAVQLVLKLTWAIFLLFLFFLIVELCVIFVIKTWYPDRINVVNVMEWTFSTILRFGRSIFSMFYYLVSSVFDLVFGKAFRNQSTNSTSNTQVASRNKDASQLRPARNGYTPLAIRAMTNSANSRPNNTKRFSL
ncbi:hypothetical protein Ocin01_10244 [Orchesella cincta]|uniref:Uncharacterized protein n=1 Tax=Orchesella cincta TaxID=48709 RepID=A0A1D2MU77_ORCCI|nr:hypothetical protein Ocin01_10244 [Orchesella cincta]